MAVPLIAMAIAGGVRMVAPSVAKYLIKHGWKKASKAAVKKVKSPRTMNMSQAKKAVPKAAPKVAPKTAAKAAPKTAAKAAPKTAAKAAPKTAAKVAPKGKIARNIRRAAPAAVPLGLTSALIALDKKEKTQAAMPRTAKPKPGAGGQTRYPSRAHPEKGIGAGREREAAQNRLARSPSRAHPEKGIGAGREMEAAQNRKDAAAAKKEKQGYNFFKGSKQEVTLPKWLGGDGKKKVIVDSSDAAFDYMDDPELNLKRGGRLKKKTKPRKRAALRGHRAELRGG